MVPRFANGIEAAAVRFQDQAAYAATTLHGTHLTHPVSLYPPAPADVTPSSVIIALCSVLLAVVLALAALYWRRSPADMTPTADSPTQRRASAIPHVHLPVRG